jgi:hypothetical protein
MKDQITAVLEALRLVELQVENFRRRHQGRDKTLASIEDILEDPKVCGALRTLELVTDAPSIVPAKSEAAA